MALKYKNEQKNSTLRLRTEALQQEEENRKRLHRSKDHITFNFEYFTSGQDAGEDFCEWSYEQLIKLLQKMTEYSKKTKIEWLNEKIFWQSMEILELALHLSNRRLSQKKGYNGLDTAWKIRCGLSASLQKKAKIFFILYS